MCKERFYFACPMAVIIIIVGLVSQSTLICRLKNGSKKSLLPHQPRPILIGKHIVDSHSLQRLHLQESLDELLAFLGNVIVYVCKLTFLDFIEQLCLRLGPERVVPLQHHVKEDTQRPHVCVNRTVVDLGYYFRSHVSRGPAESIDCLILFASKTEPEVDQFELTVPVDEYIFCFDIPMDNISAMEIKQGLCDDINELLCLALLEPMFRFGEEVVVKGVGSPVLQHQVQLGLGLDDIDEFGDGVMVKFSQDIDLSLEVLYLVGLI